MSPTAYYKIFNWEVRLQYKSNIKTKILLNEDYTNAANSTEEKRNPGANGLVQKEEGRSRQRGKEGIRRVGRDPLPYLGGD